MTLQVHLCVCVLRNIGSAKRKRTTYRAFEKRNRHAIVDELMRSHQLVQRNEEDKCQVEELFQQEELELGVERDVKLVSSTYIDLNASTISRACQTEELIATRPTENKCCKVQVKVRDCGMETLNDVAHVMCGPDDPDCPIDKNFQFPEEAQ